MPRPRRDRIPPEGSATLMAWGPQPATGKASLGQQAYRAIRALIFSGHIRAGQFVSQRELAERTGLSLAPIREAIQRLATDGVIHVIPQRGIQVRQMAPKQVRDAFGFRLMIEDRGVRQFILDAEEPAIAQLEAAHREVLDRAEAGITDDLLRHSQAVDWALHEAIVRILDNEVVWHFYCANSDIIRLVRLDSTLGLLTARNLRRVMGEHLAVIEAIRRRDAEAASAAMRYHVEQAQRLALGLEAL